MDNELLHGVGATEREEASVRRSRKSSWIFSPAFALHTFLMAHHNTALQSTARLEKKINEVEGKIFHMFSVGMVVFKCNTQPFLS